ncbi:Do family serine endopeptidase [Dongshaea marina]|uniref:Do family serine endopeptidase n=1 Tax=Dongshaea marina TaxID=2047966 RepID=UPI000D3E36BC|nr:Do family serine endopeptidase [Dongshaea marina]
MKRALTLFTVLVFSLGGLCSPVFAALPANLINSQGLPSLAPVISKSSPAVVTVSVSGKKITRERIPEAFKFFFGPNMPSEQTQERAFKALGSGVIIDAKKGYIVTNNHVVQDADEIMITLKDGRKFKAKKIGADTQSDIALLQIDAKDLTALPFADSDSLKVGDFVIAIGNPFGLTQTATAGIVSALGRSGLNVEHYENFIQTDAAINTGNSGGALVNLKGELVGINTAILGPNGGNIGIGFAIPSGMVKNLVSQILKYGEVRRGTLGIMGGELTSDLAKAFGYDKDHGAFVSQVLKDSAAQAAGLKAGDIIISINGKKISSFGELRAKIATMGAGKEITLGVFRDGKINEFKVTLRRAEDHQVKASVITPALEGATLSTIEEKEGTPGVLVEKVIPNSPAFLSGLRKNDIIIGVNRQRIKNMGELRKALKNKQELLALNIQRGNNSLYLVIR